MINKKYLIQMANDLIAIGLLSVDVVVPEDGLVLLVPVMVRCAIFANTVRLVNNINVILNKLFGFDVQLDKVVETVVNRFLAIIAPPRGISDNTIEECIAVVDVVVCR